MLNTTAKELLIPGAIILLRTPQGEFTVTYGTTQLGATIPPTADTYFRIASNTKTMTAAIIMQLAQENKLRLDDPVSKYIRGVPNGDHITIAELLDMRSGLYNFTNAPEISATMDHHPARVWSPAELLAIAFAHKPNFPPNTTYEYNNTNYAAPRPDRRKAHRQATGRGDARTDYSTRCICSTPSFPPAPSTRSPIPTRTATCTAAPRSRW